MRYTCTVRKLVTKKDIIWIVLLVAVIGLLWLWWRGGERGAIARIYRDQTVIAVVDLSEDRLIRPDEHVVIEVKDGRIRFLKSDCPDQVCVRAGWLGEAGAFASCLPNHLWIEVESSDGDDRAPDIVIGQ